MKVIDLSKRVAVVTGGSGKIGRGLCRGLAECGANVVICYFSNKEAAEKIQSDLEKSYNIKAMAIKTDITSKNSIMAMKKQVNEKLGIVDIIVNNAFILHPWRKVLEQDLESYESQFKSTVVHNVLMIQAIMATLYDSGARVQELIYLKAADVRLGSPATITLTGKADKRRCVPLMEKTRNLLEGYMRENSLLKNEYQSHPIFYNSRKHPFTRPGITYILKKYLRKAKRSHPEVIFPKDIHPHMFRHSKAMHLLEAGINLIYIRDFLGHVNVTTTETYLRADTEKKRKALESVYMDVVTGDVPLWQEDTDLLIWLEDFCR